MQIGTRVHSPQEVNQWDTDILQISVYYGIGDNVTQIRKCVEVCKERQKRYVIHPVLYSLFHRKMFRDLKVMADLADIAIILHDEKTSDWKRLTGEYETTFRELLNELQSVTTVSFENAADTRDVVWFWNTYADSITFDLGHVELAGMDSIQFVKSLDKAIIDKIQYVHVHRNNGWRNGPPDHWYLTPDCREVQALKELLKRKSDVGVLLEINETEKTEESLEILRKIRAELAL